MASKQILAWEPKAQVPYQSIDTWNNIRLSMVTFLRVPTACYTVIFSPAGKDMAGTVHEFQPHSGMRIRLPLDDYNIKVKLRNPSVLANVFQLWYGVEEEEVAVLNDNTNHMAYTCKAAITPTPGNAVLFPLKIRTRIEVPKLRAVLLSVGSIVNITLVAVDEDGALIVPSIATGFVALSSSERITGDFAGIIEFTDVAPFNPGDNVGVYYEHGVGVPNIAFSELV